jgi:hypothetical protein
VAFPTVAATNTSVTAVADVNHTVSLPASISAGDLLVVFFGVFTGTVTTPTGWTSLDALSGWYKFLYRVADGSEGATLAVATGSSTVAIHLSYRITGQHASTAPEVGTRATATSANPNPPSLDPAGWGAEDTLWIVFNNADGSDTTGYPASYSNGIATFTGSTAGGMAARQLNATSEDPGTFTLTGSVQWQANTVAVRPAAAAGGTTANAGHASGRGRA